MSEQRQMLREISWHECFPWLMLFRTPFIAFYLRVLLLAYLGVCTMNFGGWLGQKLFLSSGNAPVAMYAHQAEIATFPSPISSVDEPISTVWNEVSAPFRSIFYAPFSIRQLALSLFFALWICATWAFFGGAICRIAALELAISDRCGLKAAVIHGLKKFVAYFLSPVFPMIGVFGLLFGILVFGWINWIGVWASVLTGIFGFIAVIFAVIISLLLVPLLAGWPLMWGTISCERSDHFDALSRSYAYVTQRPFHYLGYLLVGAFCGVVGLYVATLLENVASHVLMTGLLWGQGTEHTTQIWSHSVAGPIWRFWFDAIGMFSTAYSYAFLFCIAAGFYLLLRRDVDQAEIDEIVTDDPQPRFAPPALEKEVAQEPAAPPESPGRSDETN